MWWYYLSFYLIKIVVFPYYRRADKLLGYIKSIQRQNENGTSEIIPSFSKIEKEIDYDKSNIFKNLKNVYALLSVLLLILTFIDNLRSRKIN